MGLSEGVGWSVMLAIILQNKETSGKTSLSIKQSAFDVSCFMLFLRRSDMHFHHQVNAPIILASLYVLLRKILPDHLHNHWFYSFHSLPCWDFFNIQRPTICQYIPAGCEISQIRNSSRRCLSLSTMFHLILLNWRLQKLNIPYPHSTFSINDNIELYGVGPLPLFQEEGDLFLSPIICACEHLIEAF